MRIVQRIRIGFLPVQGIPLRDGSEILALVADLTVRFLRDPKGGDPSEWPEDLRVREFPEIHP